VATTIFFESNGGMMKAEATVPEIRLAAGEPDGDIGNVETVLETLGQSCYYLSIDRTRYRFSLTPNLNKLLSDRRASIGGKEIDERVRAEIQKVFSAESGVERVFFPEQSNAIADRPALTLAVLAPEHSMDGAKKTTELARSITWECGKSGRTFKSAIVWAVAQSAQPLREEARKVLAWEEIKAEEDDLRLDDAQKRQLDEQVKRARRDLQEAVFAESKSRLPISRSVIDSLERPTAVVGSEPYGKSPMT